MSETRPRLTPKTILENAETYLATGLTIQVVDNRIFNGQLGAIDPKGNMILEQTWETTPETGERRFLGLVSIREHIVQSIEPQQSDSTASNST